MIKEIVKIRSLFKGYMIRTLLMTAVLVISIWTGVKSFAEINDMLINYNVISQSTLGNAYIYSYYYTLETFKLEDQNRVMGQVIDDLRNDPSVETVLSVRTTNDIGFEEDGKISYFTILVYDEGMDMAFPVLRKLGIDFSKNPDGAILASRVFNTLHRGDDMSFTIYPTRQKVSVKIAGHMRYPYKYISFGGGGTEMSLDDLFSKGDLVIMQSTESTLKLVDRINYYPDILISFSSDASEKEVASVIETLKRTGNVDSIDEMTERYLQELAVIVKQGSLRPMFFMLASLIAFLSLMIMMIRSKERELAIAYLCGATKGQCAFEIFKVGTLMALIPSLINIIMILIVPELTWRGMIVQDESVITSDLIWAVVVYFVIILAVSTIVVIVSIRKKSPVKYLRGLE